MRLKYTFFLLAVVPLILVLGMVSWVIQWERKVLAERQQELVRQAILNVKRDELEHYMSLAMSAINTSYNSGRDDAQTKQEVMRQLEALDYGPDGYFFLYDLQGVVIMHSRQPDLVGQSLFMQSDRLSTMSAEKILARARHGGGFVSYRGIKPSTQAEVDKLGYVEVLDRWGWVLGTGLYVEDMDETMADLDKALATEFQSTLVGIAGVGVLGLLLVFAATMGLNLSERRVNEAKLLLLTRQLVHSQEQERAYMSRELHDGVGQTLVVIKLMVESALERLRAHGADLTEPLERALERLKASMQEVRGLSHRMRPVMLDTLGLAAALQNLGQDMCAQMGAIFNLSVEGSTRPLPGEINSVLFRIAQESLTNVHKHAQASHVDITLNFGSGHIELLVDDDGNGFDVAAVLAQPDHGIGLHNMRERALAIGAGFAVTSAPGRTQVRVTVPWRVIEKFAKVSTGGRQT